MRYLTSTILGALALSATPAFAQDDAEFSGPYVGASVGYAFQGKDDDEVQNFDRGFNGSFDTITTTTGADAFSPGFCGGTAQGTTPGAGCEKDGNDIEYHARAGWDFQFGKLVVGAVGEIGKSNIRDSVSSFSTTPAFYTITREIDWDANIRLRAGYVAGTSTLIYATGGAAYASIENSFTTSNTVNAFSDNGDTKKWGYAFGGGIEHKMNSSFSIGLEYLYTRYEDDDYRVRATAGNAVASNPFVLNGQPGTEFSRSDPKFDFHAVRAVVAYRF